MDVFRTDSSSDHECLHSSNVVKDALNVPALSQNVLSKLLDGREDDIEWPIHLLVTDAVFISTASDSIFYRLWLSDDCCSTAGGLITYDLFWTSKIVKDEFFDPEEWPVIKVQKLHCYALRSANRPVFELEEFEVVGWVEATPQSTTNLDDLFAAEPLSGDESEEEILQLQEKNSPPVDPTTQSQNPCTVTSLDEDDASYDELGMMDLELEALGRARGRLVLLSPPVWEPNGTYHYVRFNCIDDKIVSGRVPTPLLPSLPPVNSACVLNVCPPVSDLHMTIAHLGDATDARQLSPVQFKPTQLSKVRRLKAHTACDVLGVLIRGPCRKDFGNHEQTKFVIYIGDQSSRFELPVEMWPSATKQLNDLPENTIIAICNARRSTLNMSCLYLRFDSMILVQPDWLEEAKQLQAWWSSRSEAPIVSSLQKLTEDAKEGVVSEGMLPCLRVVDIGEGLRCEIRCPNCSLKAYDLAQVKFVCTECGPIQNVQVLEISTELRLNDKNADYWVTLEKEAFKLLLDLPEKVFASVDSPHIYAKVMQLKGKELRAKIRHYKDGRTKFVITEAEILPDLEEFPDLN